MPVVVLSDMCVSNGSESQSEGSTPSKKPRINVRKNALIEKRSKKLRKSNSTKLASKIPRTKLTFKLTNLVTPLPKQREESFSHKPVLVNSSKPLIASQNTSPKFPLRKSLTETEMEYKAKNVQKSGIMMRAPPIYYPNMKMTKSNSSNVFNCKSSQHCVSCTSSCKLVQSESSSSANTIVSRSVPMDDENMSFIYSNESLSPGSSRKLDPRLSGMKVFSSILLNAWRHRRSEARNLLEEIRAMRNANIKLKNEVHVLNSIVRVDKKNSNKLSQRYQLVSDEYAKLQKKHDKLSNLLIDQKSFSKIYECQLSAKDKELDDINIVLDETKANLFKSMSVNRDIEKKLSCAQREILNLQNHKNELINQTFRINAQKFKIQKELRDELSAKEEELSKAKVTIDLLENRLLDLKIKESQVVEYEGRDLLQKSLINDLQVENENLKVELKRTMGNRMLALMNNTILPSAGTTLRFMHLFTYYLLPATPPPKTVAFPLKFSGIKTFCGSYTK